MSLRIFLYGYVCPPPNSGTPFHIPLSTWLCKLIQLTRHWFHSHHTGNSAVFLLFLLDVAKVFNSYLLHSSLVSCLSANGLYIKVVSTVEFKSTYFTIHVSLILLGFWPLNLNYPWNKTRIMLSQNSTGKLTLLELSLQLFCVLDTTFSKQWF